MGLMLSNHDDTVIVRKSEIKAITIHDLTIILKMEQGPDIVLDTAPDQSTLEQWVDYVKTQLEAE